MSATEELRRLLEERGVEWSAFGDEYADQTLVHTERFGRCAVTEWPTGLDVHLFNLTPEQAVEATLGRGECHDSNNRFNAWQCSECGATVLLMFDDFDEPTYSVNGSADVPKYCPNCGRKVVDE